MTLPLWALASQAYVAYTIEFDNEAERRLPHRKTRHGGSGPWLVSMAMWFNCMRFVRKEGISVGELRQSALTQTNLNGMVRWGYVALKNGAIFPTAKGEAAQHVWASLFDTIEKRWRERLGDDAIHRLRASLVDMVSRLGRALPDVMPILAHGLRVQGRVLIAKRPPPERDELAALTLPSLLAKPLIAMAILYEHNTEVSLAIGENVLRVIEAPTAVRDLPALSGISKEAIATALTFLLRRGYVTVATANRARIVALTPKGMTARARHFELVDDVETQVRAQFGYEIVLILRNALEFIVRPGATPAPLLAGLEPYPENWRAAVRRPARLPRFPVVLHRGGYPDGS